MCGGSGHHSPGLPGGPGSLELRKILVAEQTLAPQPAMTEIPASYTQKPRSCLKGGIFFTSQPAVNERCGANEGRARPDLPHHTYCPLSFPLPPLLAQRGLLPRLLPV